MPSVRRTDGLDDRSDPLDRLVAAVLASPKYQGIAREVVERIGRRALDSRRGLDDAIKSTKSKLHQVGGAYLEREAPYATWLSQLRGAREAGDGEGVRRLCQEMMRRHASTRERLPILEQLFAATLAPLAPIHSVLDLACGYNPLALPWMPLAPDVEYVACDIYTGLVGFIGEFLEIMQVRGQAEVCDLTQTCPTQRVDVALLLKAIPCLEQLDKEAGRRLLRTIDARHLLVSFPVRSLGGRRKGMASTYEAHLQALLAGTSWSLRRFEYATELAFLLAR